MASVDRIDSNHGFYRNCYVDCPMTAEQLEELLRKGQDPDCEWCGRDDNLLIFLIHKVIAAEKLADAAKHVCRQYYERFEVYIEGMDDLDAALTAYREISN